nr:glycosyltransferase [Acaryochloris sp. IP29b_bin.137]
MLDAQEAMSIGIVAIGRNEGDRLKACLQSAIAQVSKSHIVYVDSGSTDDSVAWAGALAITVLNLDLSIPFTAARARNAGFNYLCSQFPALKYVQFVDGDCFLEPTWCQQAHHV